MSGARGKNVRGPGNKCPGPGEKILKTNNRTDASADGLGRPWIRDSGENVQCALRWNEVEKCEVQLWNKVCCMAVLYRSVDYNNS